MSLLRNILKKNETLRHKFNRFIIREYEQKLNLKQRFHNSKNDFIVSNKLIKKALDANKPSLIGRMGGTEARVLSYYYFNRMNKKHKSAYTQFILDEGAVLSGIIPPIEEIGDYFCEKYIEAIKATDIMSVWGVDNESIFVEDFCPNIPTITLESLTPFDLHKPWTMKLAGRNILVATSFTDSIVNQYKKRELIFENSNVLPEFNLIPYKTIQAYGGKNANYKSYSEVLDKMSADIMKIDFDIALIGAGAYALPLGKVIKDIGKIAITTCGATQLLFGIKGARWLSQGVLTDVLTDHWIDLPDSEKPHIDTKATEILKKFELEFPYGKKA